MPLSEALATLPGSTLVLVSQRTNRSSITLGRGSLAPARMTVSALARLVASFTRDQYGLPDDRLIVRVA